MGAAHENEVSVSAVAEPTVGKSGMAAVNANVDAAAAGVEEEAEEEGSSEETPPFNKPVSAAPAAAAPAAAAAAAPNTGDAVASSGANGDWQMYLLTILSSSAAEKRALGRLWEKTATSSASRFDVGEEDLLDSGLSGGLSGKGASQPSNDIASLSSFVGRKKWKIGEERNGRDGKNIEYTSRSLPDFG